MTDKAFIFDFDGTAAFLFEDYDFMPTKMKVRKLLAAHGIDFDICEDMFDVFSRLENADINREKRKESELLADRILRDAEMEAVENCRPVEGFPDILAKMAAMGIPVAFASNNSPEAVKLFLSRHLPSVRLPIYGRDPEHLERLKPSGWMIRRCAEDLGVPVEKSVFVGDARSDHEAAGDAGAGFLAMVPRKKKKDRMSYLDPSLLYENWYQLFSVISC